MWLRDADNAVLKGRIAVAESLYQEALTYAPYSRKASFKLGHHYFENAQKEQGLQILRDSGWLLDVSMLAQAPVVDGRLDDEVWKWADTSSPFLIWSRKHDADMLPEMRTVILAGYTREALYLAARCEDAHPESLVVVSNERDHPESWLQDLVEFFIDTNLDTESYVKPVINSVGAIVDSYAPGRSHFKRPDYTVNFDSEAAAYVGEDYWSMEYKLLFGQPHVPNPVSGTIWGVDASRGHRAGAEWTQWTRGFTDMHPTETFGWFLFE